MKAAALAALFLLAAAPQAFAQTAPFAGIWRVQTASHPASACVIAGAAEVTRRDQAESYDIRFSAVETCPGESDRVTAEQVCEGRALGRRMIVRCAVERSSVGDDYKPDNFVLTVENRDLLIGRLDDDHDWDVPVRWRRGEELVS